jgi:hypothetical protein
MLPGSTKIQVAIPDLKANLEKAFGKQVLSSQPCQFMQFGAVIEFSNEMTVPAFDDMLVLHPELKSLINQYGAVILRNVRILEQNGSGYQKNIFPNLVFHIDRGPQFSNQYTFFYRNPDDPEHYRPRTTSTLITPNLAAQLQARRENLGGESTPTNIRLFNNNSQKSAIGNYVLEQKWDAPEGTGEVCILDNRTTLHASYHRQEGGYPISVKYLS